MFENQHVDVEPADNHTPLRPAVLAGEVPARIEYDDGVEQRFVVEIRGRPHGHCPECGAADAVVELVLVGTGERWYRCWVCLGEVLKGLDARGDLASASNVTPDRQTPGRKSPREDDEPTEHQPVAAYAKRGLACRLRMAYEAAPSDDPDPDDVRDVALVAWRTGRDDFAEIWREVLSDG